MKITRKQLQQLINEAIFSPVLNTLESYPANFPESLKGPGMRVISIYSYRPKKTMQYTFIDNPEFSKSTFGELFNNDLALNGAYIEFYQTTDKAKIVIKQKIDDVENQLKLSQNSQYVGNVLDMLRTQRPGFVPFTHIISVRDMYSGSGVELLDDDAIMKYCPEWRMNRFNDEWI